MTSPTIILGCGGQKRALAAGETRSARVMGVSPQGLAHRGSHLVPGREVETDGWEASCACGAGVVPCTVLDPFGGSGTTAGVAIAHGRAAILVEPSAEYRALIPDRVRDVVARETAAPRARRAGGAGRCPDDCRGAATGRGGPAVRRLPSAAGAGLAEVTVRSRGPR